MLSTKTREGLIYVNYIQDERTYQETNLENTSQPEMKLLRRSAEFLQIEAKNMSLKFLTVMRFLSHQPEQLKDAALIKKVNHTTQAQTKDGGQTTTAS